MEELDNTYIIISAWTIVKYGIACILLGYALLLGRTLVEKFREKAHGDG